MQGHILYAYTYTKVGAVMNFVQSLPHTDEARSLSAFDGLHVPCIFVICQHFMQFLNLHHCGYMPMAQARMNFGSCLIMQET